MPNVGEKVLFTLESTIGGVADSGDLQTNVHIIRRHQHKTVPIMGQSVEKPKGSLQTNRIERKKEKTKVQCGETVP